MSNVFLFDVDGTLTLPRQRMTNDFADIFRTLVRSRPVYLVSGSDLEKLKEQVPADILADCRGIFSSSGNQLDIGKELIYQNELEIDSDLAGFLNKCLSDTDYHTKTGNHIEHRPGMVNFSIVGRNASNEQRKEYYNWDKSKQERKKIAILLMAKFSNLDVKIGGEISIDIYPEGYDKRQSVDYLREHHPDDKICFFGDRTDKNGNDYSVVISLSEEDNLHAVKNYLQTKEIISSYLRGIIS